MSIVYNSSETAKTINRAIDNNQGTTTTEQGASAAGLIINEDLQNVVQCTAGYMNPFAVKTISGSPPVEFHAIDHELISWSISGNTDSGDSVGDKTANLFDKDNADIYPATNISTSLSRWSAYDGIAQTVRIPCSASTTYSISIDPDIEQTVFRGLLINTDNVPTLDTPVLGTVVISSSDDNTATFTTLSDTKYIVLQISATVFDAAIDSLMMVTGSTPQDYEHYGCRIPIICGNVTTNAYISDVLRKSTGDTPVYDIMYSDGTITRNVDTDGTPLETPTTESYTPVLISTIWGFNTFDVDTTVSPSSVTIEYYDN